MTPSLASANGPRFRYTVDMGVRGEYLPIAYCGSLEDCKEAISIQTEAYARLGLSAPIYRIRNTATGEVIA